MNGKQLKNSILQLAIQGKLVPQDPNEEPSSKLLERIRKEKEQLVKEGKLKKKDLVSEPIADEEKPFEIPESWEWCRLSSIAEVIGGFAFSSQDIKGESGTRVVRISDFNEHSWVDTKIARYNDKESLTQYELNVEDILMAMTGGTVGKSLYVTYLPERMLLNQRVAIIRTHSVLSSYIDLLIKSPLIQDVINERKNSTNDNISMGDITGFLIPLPPLSEQHRIVAKIEELMPLVEEYDKAQTKLNDLNEKLPDALKKSILQEAIQGKLVPQDPNDEPASKLLERIRKEKEQLVKEGKLKKKDLVSEPIADEEKPFEIPESWEWCRLGEICTFLSRGKSPKYSDVPNQYPVFAQKCNLKDGGISLEQARFLDPNTIDKWQEIYKLKTDDILVNSTGTGTVCRTRLFHENYLGQYPFTVPDSHVTVVRTFAEISSAFYYYIFNSKHIQDYWEERLAGSTNQKELYIGTIQETIIPLPPLSEQHRIVAKIEELFGTLK